jgi:dipeptidyl-peptidase-4
MRTALRIVSFLSLLPAAAGAQSKSLSIEAIFGGGMSVPSPSEVRFAPDGRVSFFFPAGNGRDLVAFDPATGAREVLVPSAALRTFAPSPSEAEVDQRETTRRTRFGVPDYVWSPDGKRLLSASSGTVLVYDVAGGQTTGLAPAKTGVLDPKFSPDGTWVSFIYQHDLWVVPAAGGDEKQLTFGGTDSILHGELDWVYPEELGIRTGYEWSPDSRRIAFLELDETLVPTYPITEELSRQATVDLQRYPKPGDPNPRVRLGIVSVEPTGPIDNVPTRFIDRASEYIPRMKWVDGARLSVQLLNRGQDELELIVVDGATGRSRTLLIEKDPYWVNVSDDLTFLDGGGFLWTSERTGFLHIYRYDEKGSLSRALTEGEWQVSRVEGVDERAGLVYFTANRDNPIGQDLYRVRLDGTGLERMTNGKGTHAIQMGPNAAVYLDSFSSLTDPGRTTCRDIASGREHPFQDGVSLEAYELVRPEYRLLDAPDGEKVALLLMKPGTLEEGRKYPLVAYVYGMPGFPTIRDAWGGSRYLFHQFLVQQGYVVVQIDDRTSSIWGHRYAALGDHNVGPVAARDHEVAVEYLTSLPFIDSAHTAVWGWSGGGFTTTYHMARTKLFQFGIAGAPVTDWHTYDSIYTERYMGIPSEDPEAYERTSAVKGVSGEGGRLLLIHGTHDDNVHPQNTLQYIDALIQSGRQFDLMWYPNQTHGIRGKAEVLHLWTMVYEYLERNLK